MLFLRTAYPMERIRRPRELTYMLLNKLALYNPKFSKKLSKKK
jgi:hypothetical protein